MRQPANIGELVKLDPDYIGFIFYPKSKRFIGNHLPDEIGSLIPESVQKVGVFVDEPFDSLVEQFQRSKLDLVQLHGGELPEYCKRLGSLGIPVIKAFSISSDFDFQFVKPYNHFCDYYLFDASGELRGGTGLKFEWEKLNQYVEEKPFFLSGGINQGDIGRINKLLHNQLYAVDVNSGFETETGMKDISKLKSFIEGVRKQEGLEVRGF